MAMQHDFNKTGVSLNTTLDWINFGIAAAVNHTDFNLTYNFLLQEDVYLIFTILNVCAAMVALLSTEIDHARRSELQRHA